MSQFIPLAMRRSVKRSFAVIRLPGETASSWRPWCKNYIQFRKLRFSNGFTDDHYHLLAIIHRRRQPRADRQNVNCRSVYLERCQNPKRILRLSMLHARTLAHSASQFRVVSQVQVRQDDQTWIVITLMNSISTVSSTRHRRFHLAIKMPLLCCLSATVPCTTTLKPRAMLLASMTLIYIGGHSINFFYFAVWIFNDFLLTRTRAFST